MGKTHHTFLISCWYVAIDLVTKLYRWGRIFLFVSRYPFFLGGLSLSFCANGMIVIRYIISFIHLINEQAVLEYTTHTLFLFGCLPTGCYFFLVDINYFFHVGLLGCCHVFKILSKRLYHIMYGRHGGGGGGK